MGKKRTITAAMLAAAATGPALAAAVPTVVAVDGGEVRGVAEPGVIAWKGIPFAAPSVGANRWRSPQPVVPWAGVRDASAYGHDCMQKPFPSDAAPLGTAPAEDCLVVNVWRPETPAAKLPVMVWIYGGGFVNGGSSPAVYSGAPSARRGVVFVSFNYRLGRFGFFAHPALSAAGEGPLGNYGYQDQVAALRWVRRNIAAFGGDPANVTVFGESAGGASALTVLTSPATRGLFARVMVMSGGGRGALMAQPRLSQDQPNAPSAETVGTAFAAANGIRGTGPEALAALRALPADKVVAGLNLDARTPPAGQPATYVGGPIEDGTLVTGTTQQLLTARSEAPVAVMIGSTGADAGGAPAASLDALFAPFGSDAARVRAAYDPAGGGDPARLGREVGMDQRMAEPARFVAAQVTAAGRPAYLYRFDYVAAAKRSDWEKAPHATDIPFFLDTVSAKYGAALTPADEAMARTANAYLTNFAKTGDPNGAGLPRWTPFGAGDRLMRFTLNDGAVFGPDPRGARLDALAAHADGATAGR